MLADVRLGKLSAATMATIRQVVERTSRAPPMQVIKLFPLRAQVAAANADGIAGLAGPARVYHARDFSGVRPSCGTVIYSNQQRLIDTLDKVSSHEARIARPH